MPVYKIAHHQASAARLHTTRPGQQGCTPLGLCSKVAHHQASEARLHTTRSVQQGCTPPGQCSKVAHHQASAARLHTTRPMQTTQQACQFPARTTAAHPEAPHASATLVASPIVKRIYVRFFFVDPNLVVWS